MKSPFFFILFAASLLCACQHTAAEVRPAVADDYVATTGVIASKTGASAQRIYREARTLPATAARETILLESAVIAALSGPASAADLDIASRRANADYDRAFADARALREQSVVQAAAMAQLQSRADALAGEVARLRAIAEEARRTSVNWVFLAGAIVAGIGAAGFGLLFWLQRDRDWLVLSASCAASAVVLPFIPELINSLWFKVPVGAAVLAFLGWMGVYLWRELALRRAQAVAAP